MVLLAKAGVTPAGKPVAIPIPVAPVVACVIFGIAELMHIVGEDDAAPTVFAAVTVIDPAVLSVHEPTVNRII